MEPPEISEDNMWEFLGEKYPDGYDKMKDDIYWGMDTLYKCGMINETDRLSIDDVLVIWRLLDKLQSKKLPDNCQTCFIR